MKKAVQNIWHHGNRNLRLQGHSSAFRSIVRQHQQLKVLLYAPQVHPVPLTSKIVKFLTKLSDQRERLLAWVR